MTDPGPLLASGRDADVYALDSGQVLRRYRRPGRTDHEAAVMAHARSQGFPVPEAAALSDTDVVLERLEGPSMLNDLLARPRRTVTHARTLATLHRQLHAIEAPSGMPEPYGPGDRLLHLDLRPGNVLLTPHGPFVID